MRRPDIPILATRNDDMSHARMVRLRAPKYLQSVIEDDRALPGLISLDDLHAEQISPLGGGKDAATYLVVTDSGQWVIKLGVNGIEAEVEALKHWYSKGARVPKVIGSGTVPLTRKTTPSIKYIVEEAVLDKFGRVAETCENYLTHKPEDARKVGRLMGEELQKMHMAKSKRSFGNFSDTDANTGAYQSWNNYLLGYIQVHKKYLLNIGISNDLISTVRQFISECTFTRMGIYLHGDFSPRNAAIQPNRNRITMFDPNPIIGDPSWDVAVLFNNSDFRKRRLKYDDSEKIMANRYMQILIGFKQKYPVLPPNNVISAQLIQAILQAQYQKTKGDKTAQKVREEFIMDIVNKIGKAKND